MYLFYDLHNMIIAIISVISLLVVLGLFAMTYTVVNPNDAHIVVFMGKGRKIYTPAVSKTDGKEKTSYFFIPVLMKRFVLPLSNVKIAIRDISLNDKEVAPFMCDVVTWLHINDPITAAERLNLSQPFETLSDDLQEIVQAIARAVSMKKEILEIMRDRSSFSQEVSVEVGDVLSKWGVELINLEVNDIRDTTGSSIIKDYESIRAATVEANSRKQVSIQQREAVEVEQENLRQAEIAKAQAQEAYQKRQIQRDQEVGITKEEARLEVMRRQEQANQQEVETQRKRDVGLANVEKEATIEKAQGEAEAIRIKGEKEAEVQRLQGNALADVISRKGLAEAKVVREKGLSEAEAKDKMAEAMQKFNEAATLIEKLQVIRDIEKAKFSALGESLSKADLKLVSSGKGGNLFGFPLNAETGADLGQMMEALDNKEGLSGLLNKVLPNKEQK